MGIDDNDIHINITITFVTVKMTFGFDLSQIQIRTTVKNLKKTLYGGRPELYQLLIW